MDSGKREEVYFLGSIVLIKKPGVPEADADKGTSEAAVFWVNFGRIFCKS
jgi:hypothetical protein